MQNILVVEDDYDLITSHMRQRPSTQSITEQRHSLDQTEYYMDILCTGDSYERVEVV